MFRGGVLSTKAVKIGWPKLVGSVEGYAPPSGEGGSGEGPVPHPRTVFFNFDLKIVSCCTF